LFLTPQLSTDAIARLHDNIREDRTARDISLELAHFSVGLVDITGTDNRDEMSIKSERNCKVPNVEWVQDADRYIEASPRCNNQLTSILDEVNLVPQAKDIGK
jgi:hypothetical protein